jgi:hypothetical protein
MFCCTIDKVAHFERLQVKWIITTDTIVSIAIATIVAEGMLKALSSQCCIAAWK